MAVSEQFLKAYKKATGQLVEKPGNTMHTAAFDRCVEHVQGKGKNAYAICTAAMGDNAFKSMDYNSPDFVKEVDLFMEKLGIAGAGPVPNSLLARQDLEGVSEKSFSKKSRIQKDGSVSFSVWYHDADGNRKCEVYNSIIDAEAAVKEFEALGYRDVYIHNSQETTEKAGNKRWIVRCNGTDWGCYDVKSDAETAMEYLLGQGTYAVLVEETVLEAEKGQVEQTGKQLSAAVRAAKQVDDTEESETIADRIKNIQLRRQKATIEARSKEKIGKSFKETWFDLQK